MTRTSLTIPPEMEKEILRLRRTKEYCNFSKAEILRMLVMQGISNMKDHNPPTQSKATN